MRWRSIFKPSEWPIWRRSTPGVYSVEIPNPFLDDPQPEEPLEEPDLTLYRSWEELKLKQDANAGAWGLGDTDRWDVDFDTGLITFSNADGFTVTGSVQVIGTYDYEDGSWLWGWDHPSVDEPLAHAARLARDFGERHGLGQYTTRMVRCSEDDAWRFTAVGQYLSQATGAYRGPSGSTGIFMTFDEVTIRQAAPPA